MTIKLEDLDHANERFMDSPTAENAKLLVANYRLFFGEKKYRAVLHCMYNHLSADMYDFLGWMIEESKTEKKREVNFLARK